VGIAAKSGKVIENFLGAGRAFASPPVLTSPKMRTSVFLLMIAHDYA